MITSTAEMLTREIEHEAKLLGIKIDAADAEYFGNGSIRVAATINGIEHFEYGHIGELCTIIRSLLMGCATGPGWQARINEALRKAMP